MSYKNEIDQDAKPMAIACRLGLAVLPVWLALAAVWVPAAAAPVPCRALVYQGQCLGWKARPFAFSPGGRYLYFEYQYLRGNGLDFTHSMIGRYDLRRRTVRIVRSACDTHYKSGALSRDGRYLAMHAQLMGRYRIYPYVRDEGLEILDLKTGKIEWAQDQRFEFYRNIVISPDGRRVYFTQRIKAESFVERLAVYDRRTSAIVNLYPKILKSNWYRTPERNSRTIYTFPRRERFWSHRTEGGIRFFQYPHFDTRIRHLIFVGRSVSKRDAGILGPLAKRYGVGADRLRRFRLIYRFRPRDGKLSLHPANPAIIEAIIPPAQLALPISKRSKLYFVEHAVHSFVPMPSGRSYLVFRKAGEFTQHIKLRVLHRNKIRDVVAMPWFASEFVMSRDEARVAHNFWHFKRRGRVKSIAIRHLKTGRSRVIDPGALAGALLEPVAPLCVKNKSG